MDPTKAKLILNTELGKLCYEEEGQITYDEFMRLFCKGVLKQAFVQVSDKFNNMVKNKGPELEALPIGNKLDCFSRQHIINNMKPGS